MSAANQPEARVQSQREEAANSACHALGLFGAIVGTPFLIDRALREGDAGFVLGVGIFCGAMILLYAASAAYHALPVGRSKRLFFVLDHSAIFVLIAGTYTPFMLGALRGPAGWPLLAAIWTLAAVGLSLRAANYGTHPVVTTALYLVMGWLVLLDLDALIAAVPPAGLAWLVAGGALYSVGVVFFAFDARMRYGHAVWHGFVVGGTVCHYFAVLWYAA